MKTIFLMVLVPLLMLAPTLSFASHESNSKRSSDGFNDGSNAARSDKSFNPACDPQSLHTSDGQHTATYCNAWTDGYTSTWNANHGGSSTPTSVPYTSGASPSTGNGPNYSSVCQTVQPVLVQSCRTLVNGDGSLTTDGTHAMNCIKNGVLLGGGATLLGLPLPLVLKGLSILSAPTGCDGIVDMSAFNLLGNIGSISSLLNSLP